VAYIDRSSGQKVIQSPISLSAIKFLANKEKAGLLAKLF